MRAVGKGEAAYGRRRETGGFRTGRRERRAREDEERDDEAGHWRRADAVYECENAPSDTLDMVLAA